MPPFDMYLFHSYILSIVTRSLLVTVTNPSTATVTNPSPIPIRVCHPAIAGNAMLIGDVPEAHSSIAQADEARNTDAHAAMKVPMSMPRLLSPITRVVRRYRK